MKLHTMKSIYLYILYFNKPNLTVRCLQSFLTAKSHTLTNYNHWQIHIALIDNGSIPEHSLAIAEQCPPSSLNYKTLAITPNQGFAVGMNTGLRHCFSEAAENDLCLLVSNDIEVDYDFFNKFIETFDKNPLYGKSSTIFCPQVYFLKDKTKISYTYGLLDTKDMTLSHSTQEKAHETMEFPEYFPAALTIWNQGAYNKLGGFDERFFCYWEDVHLSWAAKQNGVQLRMVPNLKIYHFGRGTTGGKEIYNKHFQTGKALMRTILRSSLDP